MLEDLDDALLNLVIFDDFLCEVVAADFFDKRLLHHLLGLVVRVHLAFKELAQKRVHVFDEVRQENWFFVLCKVKVF